VGEGELQLTPDGRRAGLTISVDLLDTYFLAISHLEVIRSLKVRNVGVDCSSGPGEVELRCRVESPASSQFFLPVACQIPLPEGGRTFSLSSLQVRPDRRELARLEERITASLIVEAFIEGEQIGHVRRDLNVLAGNEFMLSPRYWSSLAAFVQPNSRDLHPVLARARVLLEDRTGSGQTGYQFDDPERVHEVVESVFDAIAELGLHYAEPPADFEGYAQRIRTPSVVLSERAATCLDSAVLLCSCLLRVGIDVGIVLADEHAFPFYVPRDPERFDEWGVDATIRRDLLEPSSEDVNALVSMVERRLVVPVESTMLTSVRTVDFEQACAAAREFTSLMQPSLNGFVNPAAAFRCGVVPQAAELASATADLEPEGAWVRGLPSGQPIPSQVRPLTANDDRERRRLDRARAPHRVEEWKRSLLRLDYASPLLSLETADDFARSLVVRAPLAVAAGAIDRLTVGGELTIESAVSQPVGVPPSLQRGVGGAGVAVHAGRLYWPDARSVQDEVESRAAGIRSANPLVTPGQSVARAESELESAHQGFIAERLEKLRIRARDWQRQTGSNSLHLCVGVFEWQGSGGQRGRAPLLMLPVRIVRSGGLNHAITRDPDGAPQVNHSLFEVLQADLGIEIPQLVEPPMHGDSIDVQAFVGEIRAILGARRLEGAKVLDEIVLDVLDFAGFQMWRDLDDHWETFLRQPVFEHLVHRPGEVFTDPARGEGLPEVVLPDSCDAYQLEAVRWAAAGRSFVLEGPPGTGKSQTITNLLATCMSLGKRVLFVAEKQTALDVVRRRLVDLGLDRYCLDLFDRDVSTTRVGEQIRGAMAFIPDDVGSEWENLERRLVDSQRRLDAYVEALHGVGPSGFSAWAARQRQLELGSGEVVDPGVGSVDLNAESLLEVDRCLRDLPHRVAAGRVALNPWSLCDREQFTEMEFAVVRESIEAMVKALAGIQRSPGLLRSLIHETATTTEIKRIANDLHSLAAAPVPSAEQVERVASPTWASDVDALIGRVATLLYETRQCLRVLDAEVLEADVSPLVELGESALMGGDATSRHLEVLRSSVAGWFSDEFVWSDHDIVMWLRAVERIQSGWIGVESDAHAVVGDLLPVDCSLREDRAVAVLESLRDDARDRVGAWISSTAEVVARESPVDPPVLAALAADLDLLVAGWNGLVQQLGVSQHSIERWLSGRDPWDAWSEDSSAWAQDAGDLQELQLWCDALDALAPLRRAGLGGLRESILRGDHDIDSVADQVLRAFVNSALAERTEVAEISVFSEEIFERTRREWAAAFDSRRRLARHRLARGVAEGIGTGSARSEFGLLDRALTVRRNQPSIRQLVSRHGETIQRIVPCFLMSPESLARFVPPGSIEFDLVVFDEASQLEVPRAVGALGRARAAVVVGDSQQLPPMSFGRRRPASSDEVWEGDAEVVVDLESILEECRQSRVPALTLSNHYRSEHEGLISFSNHFFYGGRLRTTPSPDVDRASPIVWRRVDGSFRSAGAPDPEGSPPSPVGTNPAEALAIVNEVERIVREHVESTSDRDDRASLPSIGVVTFNRPQCDLVRAMLAASELEEVRELLDRDDASGLLVQNLEGVQGDERDVVMLSIGYAPQMERGLEGGLVRGRVPLRFGPLNLSGGERRLNVAITRARRQLMVFCSFDPSELDVSGTQSRGVRLLHAFLTAACAVGGVEGSVIGRAPSPRDHHRAEVAEVLRSAGLEVAEDLGESTSRVDLAVRRSGDHDWRMAILLDGPDWADRPTTFDREVLPGELLHRAGWPSIERIWFPTWIRDRQSVVDRITRVLDERGLSVDSDPPQDVWIESTTAPVTAPDAGEAPKLVHPVGWVPVGGPAGPSAERSVVGWRPTSVYPSDLVARGRSLAPEFSPASEVRTIARVGREETPGQDALGRVVRGLLEGLAPLELGHLDRLCVLALDSVTSHAGDLDLLAQIAADVGGTVVASGFGRFVWLHGVGMTAGDPYRWNSVRSDRSLDETPPEEIENAALALVGTDGGRVLWSDLATAVQGLFDATESVSSGSSRVDAVLERLVNSGMLERTGRHVQLPRPGS
jgi:hypothetical protein